MTVVPAISAVVFDSDETLVDTPVAVRHAHEVVLAELCRLTPDAAALSCAELEADAEWAWTALAALPSREIRRRALAASLTRIGLESELDRITELFFAHRFVATRLYDGVPGLLATLRSSYVVGYATNGPNRTELVGLDGAFAFEVYALHDGVPKKPSAGFFDAVRAGAGCPAGGIVHVGDNWDHDIVGAAAAGLRTVWFNPTGRPRPAGPTTVPDAEIRSLTELPAVLTRL